MSMRSTSRQEVWDLTGGLCFYCQIELVVDSMPPRGVDSHFFMQIDHKLPASKGGSDEAANLVPACGWCNSQKHNRTVEEYRAYLVDHGIVPRFFGEPIIKRDWILPGSYPGTGKFGRFWGLSMHVWGRP